MSAVLIDTSCWVDFLRGDRRTVRRIDPLLEEGRAAIAAPIFAEVLSGAPNRAVFEKLARTLGALVVLAEPTDAWTRVAELRFTLARRGVQSGLIDLLIALTAAESSSELLTRDRDFRQIQAVLPFSLQLL